VSIVDGEGEWTVVFVLKDDEDEGRRLRNALRHYPSLVLYAGRTLADIRVTEPSLRLKAISACLVLSVFPWVNRGMTGDQRRVLFFPPSSVTFLDGRQAREVDLNSVIDKIVKNPKRKTVSECLELFKDKDGVMETLVVTEKTFAILQQSKTLITDVNPFNLYNPRRHGFWMFFCVQFTCIVCVF
jgi:hypothetical protein